MDRKKLILLVAGPVAGMAILGLAFVLRRDPSNALQGAAAAPRSAAPAYMPAAAKAAPAPAAPEVVAKNMETVRVRGTYQNYRRAVATGDAELQKSLLPVLLRDRDAARKCADEDLAVARTETDRIVAQRVLEALR